MKKTDIQKKIARCISVLDKKRGKKLQKSLLLTGGAAAFLYGSDRPFSNDVDFMLPKKLIHEAEKTFGIRFDYRKKKPIFHSLAASLETKEVSVDFIAESVVQPDGYAQKFHFIDNDLVFDHHESIVIGRQKIQCVPREFLVLIKLLAGRGGKMKKYDLIDIQKILEKSKNFDFLYFLILLLLFIRPLKIGLDILIQNAKKTEKISKHKNVRLLARGLKSLKQSGPSPRAPHPCRRSIE